MNPILKKIVNALEITFYALVLSLLVVIVLPALVKGIVTLPFMGFGIFIFMLYIAAGYIFLLNFGAVLFICGFMASFILEQIPLWNKLGKKNKTLLIAIPFSLSIFIIMFTTS